MAKVAVIGAGGSGLVAAQALRRAGVEFEVLEAREGVGGTWRYDEDGDGSACYASLVANTSKLRMSLPKRRIPGRPWQYASHADMLGYLERLTDDAGIRPYLRPGWRVAAARRDDDGWVLTSSNGEERHYRAVICALGVNGRPRFADLPGEFSGEQMHSAKYRSPSRFADRHVLVIGLGTSGGEVAGEVASVARSVSVSVRSPMWMMTRRLAGLPVDWLDDPRTSAILPWSVRRRFIRAFCRLTTGGLHRRGLPRPTRRCGDDVIAISDTFPRAVRAGLVEFVPVVRQVDGHRVSFADGTAKEIDMIVHATGFDPATDFLPEEARPPASGLYRGIAHPALADLYFVGLFEAHRALLPIAAEQADWTADVLSGRIDLPAPDDRHSVTALAHEQRVKDFGGRRPFLIDYPKYLTALRRDREMVPAASE